MNPIQREKKISAFWQNSLQKIEKKVDQSKIARGSDKSSTRQSKIIRGPDKSSTLFVVFKIE